MERGTYVDECCAAFPSVTPVCAASIATGTRQDRHRIPSMNWYHREERRYVEYGSSFSAVAALRDRPPAHRHGLQHERRAPAGRRAHRVRVARRRGPADGRDDVPHVPRPPRAPDLARDGADPAAPRPSCAARSWARRSSSTPTSSPAARPAAARSSACPACATSTPAASARTSSSTTSSTSCCSRCPTTTRTRTSNGPHAQVTSIADADRQLERMFHAGGGADAFLDEHAVIVVADHSHAPVERRIELDGAFDDVRSPAAERQRGTTRPRSRCARRSASAMVYALLPEGRDELVPQLVDAAGGLEGVDLVDVAARARARARSAARPASCASPRAATCATSAAARWSVDGPLEVLDGRRPRRRPPHAGLPGRARPRVGGADLRDVRGRPALGRARLGVRRLGRGRPRRRRQPRLAAPQRLARRARVLRRRPAGRRPPAAVVDRATWRR